MSVAKPTGESRILRRTFAGDVASTATIVVNPEVSTARGRRRKASGGANPTRPRELLVGLAHRPHISGKQIGGANVKGHGTDADYCRWVPLTKTYKSK